MKYIKYFENKDKDEVAQICKQYHIENWELQNGLVDVYDNVNLYRKKLTKLPLNFGYVSGDFRCNHNQLTTLKGCPIEVGGIFNCGDNKLTTLEGCPSEVGGSFYCYDNRLTTLEGCPSEVGDNFSCRNNKLITLKGCPNEVGGNFNCSYNQLTTLEFTPLKVSGYISWSNNPLPEEILKIANQEMQRLFLYFHHDYTLWKNGQFVKWKFEDLMDEINEYLEKHPDGIKF